MGASQILLASLSMSIILQLASPLGMLPPNHVFNRTRRYGLSTWRSSVAADRLIGLVRLLESGDLTQSLASATVAMCTSRLSATFRESRPSPQGSGIRELARLRKRYGRRRWPKRKGIAHVRLPDGDIVLAELHWYEATGIGKREFKIKRFL